MGYFTFCFFWTKSLNTSIYFTLTVYLNLDAKFSG